MLEDEERGPSTEAADSSRKSLRMVHRISAHLCIVGRFTRCGARHIKASSRIFSTVMIFVVVASTFGSRVLFASLAVSFIIACTITLPSEVYV